MNVWFAYTRSVSLPKYEELCEYFITIYILTISEHVLSEHVGIFYMLLDESIKMLKDLNMALWMYSVTRRETDVQWGVIFFWGAFDQN